VKDRPEQLSRTARVMQLDKSNERPHERDARTDAIGG
jgi:hypothetical protein